MKLSKTLSIDPVQYASQGNAILGIRDSGKSYTATFLAEQLMDAGIPIIAFDPIGIWRHLKRGKNGKGYPVVVAGEDGDLPLTPESAPNIVRAAMKENVSLIVDLYSMDLSKSDWRKIVEQSVRLLLYENKTCGLRHIFIEEAAEFSPQRVRPEEGKVYAEIEKLARMGGNASLGYTLINQRAEEVNKSVLELCDCLFLHRQKGKNSLTSLGKWLDVADTANSKEIINSLPSLGQGDCWVWMQGSHEPVKIHVPEKKTIHPDRKNPLSATMGIMADVSKFVSKMKTSLSRIEENKEESNPKTKKDTVMKSNQNGHYVPEATTNSNQRIIDLEEEIKALQGHVNAQASLRKQAEQKLESVKKLLAPQYEQMRKIFEEIGEDSAPNNGQWDIWLDKFKGKQNAMLHVLIERGRVTRQQLGLMVGMSPGSGSFNTYLSKLKSVGLIKKEGDEFVLQQI